MNRALISALTCVFLRLFLSANSSSVWPTHAWGGLAPMPSGRASLRRLCAYNNSRHFCCLPGFPGPRQGGGHSSPTALALAFCCFSTSSLGCSSGRSGTSAPFTTHWVNDMLMACKHLVQTPAHTSNHESAITNACCSFSAQAV